MFQRQDSRKKSGQSSIRRDQVTSGMRVKKSEHLEEEKSYDERMGRFTHKDSDDQGVKRERDWLDGKEEDFFPKVILSIEGWEQKSGWDINNMNRYGFDRVWWALKKVWERGRWVGRQWR